MTLRTNFSQEYKVIPDKCATTKRITKEGFEVDLYPFCIYCSNCLRRKRINPSCGKRSCTRCQLKRSRKLEEKYLPRILAEKTQRGHSWTWLTLSEIDIPVRPESLRSDITKFGNLIQKLISKEYPSGGLIVIEHTTRWKLKEIGSVLPADIDGKIVHGPATLIHYEKSLKLHAHALVCGGYRIKENLERKYGEALVKAGLLTEAELVRNRGRRYTWMEFVRSPKHTLRYMMKYVAKGVQLTDVEIELLKRTKYVRTWGFLYGMKELTFDLICADCYGKCYVAFDDETCNRFELENRDDLKILRLPKEVIGPPEKAEAAC